MQYEGETNKHGRGPANWDTFTVEHTGTNLSLKFALPSLKS